MTLSIGTVDQNLKLQQGLNSRFVENMRNNQNTMPQISIQQQQVQHEITESTQKTVDNKENTALLSSSKKDIKEQTVTQEREPEFTK